jgi:MFS family permease
MTFLGYIVPYFFISVYAQDVLGTNQNTAMNILVIAIACSFFGRLTSGVVAFKLGPIFTWFWCAATSGIVSLSWMAVHTQSQLFAWSAFWGFCSAGLVTLPAAVFPGLCPDLRRLGTRTGMSWGIGSFSSLIGSPIAAAMLTRTPTEGRARSRHDFLGPQLWAGCSLLVGSAFIFTLWALRYKEKKSIFI